MNRMKFHLKNKKEPITGPKSTVIIFLYRKTATSSIRHTTIYALPRIRRDFPNLKLFAAAYEELANLMTS